MISDSTRDVKEDGMNAQNRWRKFLITFYLVIALSLALVPISSSASQEDAAGFLKVTAKLLNGRSEPRKTASKEAFFDHGDILYATGAWSNDHKWVEVEGGETGTVWVSIRYVTERTKAFKAKNANYDKVKVRKWPETGKVIKYIYRGQTVTIKKVILGYGLTRWGWVDLYYFEYAEGE